MSSQGNNFIIERDDTRYHTLFVGIDVSQFKHDIAILNQTKQLIHKPFVISDDYQGYHFLVNKLQLLATQYHPQQFKIGVEATSDDRKNLYYFVKNQSDRFQLTIINPVQTRNWAETQLRRAKTDPIDAKDIALFMIEKCPAPSEPREPLFDIIKDIDHQIYALNNPLTVARNRLRLEPIKLAPELEKNTAQLTSQRMLALLENYPPAENIAHASLEELSKISYGNANWHLPAPFVHKVNKLAQHSIAYKNHQGAGYVVQSLVRQIRQMLNEINLLKPQILTLYHSAHDKSSLLTPIPGISKETAITLEAYIGDVNRFANAKKIVAYFGLNPTVYQSGKPKQHKSIVQKKGCAIIRQKLSMAVITIIRGQKGPIYR